MPNVMLTNGFRTNQLFYFDVCESPSSICDAKDDAMIGYANTNTKNK